MPKDTRKPSIAPDDKHKVDKSFRFPTAAAALDADAGKSTREAVMDEPKTTKGESSTRRGRKSFVTAATVGAGVGEASDHKEASSPRKPELTIRKPTTDEVAQRPARSLITNIGAIKTDPGLLELLDPRPIFTPVNVSKSSKWIAFIMFTVCVTQLFMGMGLSDAIPNFFQTYGPILQYALLSGGSIFGIFSMCLAHYAYDEEEISSGLASPEISDPVARIVHDAENAVRLDERLGLISPILTPRRYRPEYRNTALIIPCNNDAEIIEKTIRFALRHFRPKQIFIIDGGNGRYNPIKNATRRIVKAISSQINYFYFPDPNPILGIRFGLSLCKMIPGLEVKQVLTMRPNVLLPESFDLGLELLNDSHHAVTYPQTSVREDSFVSEIQRIEKNLKETERHFLSWATGQVPFPNKVCLWQIKSLQKLLSQHSLQQEEIESGYITRISLDLQIAYKSQPALPVIPRKDFDSFLASKIIKETTFEYQQFINLLISTLTKWPNDLRTTPIVKASELGKIISISTDWLKLPLVLGVLASSGWTGVAALTASFITNNIHLLSWNYITQSKRPQIQTSLTSLAAYNLYQASKPLLSLTSFLRYILIVYPNYRRKVSTTELEQLGALESSFVREIYRRHNNSSLRKRTLPTPSPKPVQLTVGFRSSRFGSSPIFGGLKSPDRAAIESFPSPYSSLRPEADGKESYPAAAVARASDEVVPLSPGVKSATAAAAVEQEIPLPASGLTPVLDRVKSTTPPIHRLAGRTRVRRNALIPRREHRLLRSFSSTEEHILAEIGNLKTELVRLEHNYKLVSHTIELLGAGISDGSVTNHPSVGLVDLELGVIPLQTRLAKLQREKIYTLEKIASTRARIRAQQEELFLITIDADRERGVYARSQRDLERLEVQRELAGREQEQIDALRFAMARVAVTRSHTMSELRKRKKEKPDAKKPKSDDLSRTIP